MKFFNILILIFPLTFFAEEITYKEGDSFESTKSRSVVLYEYKTDASRVNIALRFAFNAEEFIEYACLLYTSPSPRDLSTSRMPSSA